MNKIGTSIKKCDFFSVTYSPAISDGMNYYHSSLLGGIISIIIAVLSLIYCIYYLYLWWSYALLPKVTEDINTFDQNFDFEKLINKIQVVPNDLNGVSPINPFDRNQVVLLPLLLSVDDENLKWTSLIGDVNSQGTLDTSIAMGKNDQYILIFILCKEEYLESQQQCASEQQQQDYFNQYGNTMYTNIEFTTINPSTFESESYKRTYQLFIHSGAEMCSTITLHYQMNHYLINKAFLFKTEDEVQNYISDTLNYPQFAMKSYCDTYYMPNTYGAYWILFQQQYRTVSIAYPPISEVFAAIGSIISILFSVKYLITILNLSQLRQSILDDIMRQYYPEIKQFKILNDIWGRIVSVKFRGLPVEIPSYLAFQKQIHEHMGCKLNYKNLLYEMSRFQFVLMSLQRRVQIEKVHNVGIKVPLQLSDSGEAYVIAQGQENQLKTLNLRHIKTIKSQYDFLTLNDATILSQEYKKRHCLPDTQIDGDRPTMERGEQQNKPSEEQEPDFYEMNQIKENIYEYEVD